MLTEVAGAVTTPAFNDVAALAATSEPVVVKFQTPLVAQVAFISLVPFRLNTLSSPKNPGFITSLPLVACASEKAPKCVTLLEAFVLVVPRPAAFAVGTHNVPVAAVLELAAINLSVPLHPEAVPRTRGALIPWQKPVLRTVKVISPDIFTLVKNTEELFAILKPELAAVAKPDTAAVLVVLLEVNGVNCGLISVLSVE